MGFVRTLAVCLAFAGALCASTAAERAWEEAVKAEAQGLNTRAYLLYSEAASLDPKNLSYALKVRALKPMVMKTIQAQVGELKPDDSTPREDIAAITGAITLDDADAVAKYRGIPQLAAKPGLQDISLRSDAKTAWEKMASAFGLFVIFDADYNPPAQVRLNLTGVEYREALHAMEVATESFIVPISERVMLVAADTQQKRTDLESNEAVAVPIPERTSVQEAQELAVAVQQTMEIRRLMLDPGKRLVVMRDRVSKVEPARALLLQLLQPKPQVAIEVEFLSVTKSSSLHFGINWQTQFPLAWLGNPAKNVFGTIPAGFTRFLTFGGGTTLMGIGITDAQLFATTARSDASSLIKSDIVVADGQAASLHMGDKYPIATSGYYLGATQVGGLSAPPTFTYEDLGVTMKVTPMIHGNDEVTLDVEAEYKVLGSGSLNGIPVISNRKFEAKGVRLNTSEYAIIAGLVSERKSVTKQGFPGLSRLPLIGYLFSQTTKESDEAQTLVVIKPTIVSLAPGDRVARPLWVGSETRGLIPL